MLKKYMKNYIWVLISVLICGVSFGLGILSNNHSNKNNPTPNDDTVLINIDKDSDITYDAVESQIRDMYDQKVENGHIINADGIDAFNEIFETQLDKTARLVDFVKTIDNYFSPDEDVYVEHYKIFETAYYDSVDGCFKEFDNDYLNKTTPQQILETYWSDFYQISFDGENYFLEELQIKNNFDVINGDESKLIFNTLIKCNCIIKINRT